jgi:hypothetical protein
MRYTQTLTKGISRKANAVDFHIHPNETSTVTLVSLDPLTSETGQITIRKGEVIGSFEHVHLSH